LTLITERKAVKRKAELVEELDQLIGKYETVAIANLYKVRTIQLQQLSRKFTDIRLRAAKNNLLTRVFEKSQKSGIKKLAEHLKGSNILLLTNLNPFSLALLLDKNKTRMTAKAGDIASNDIVIPAGNTGLPPGPAISELSEAGIKTKIDMGSVWVISETVVVKKGDAIPLKVASVLSKLGIKPLEVGLDLVTAYEKGFIFTSEELRPRVDEVKRNLEEAVAQAFNLAFNSLYPTHVTVRMFIQQASLNARNLAINSNYVAPEVAKELVAKAHSHMVSLSSRLAKVNKEAAPPELR